jgi:hypothetical protein
MRCKGVIQQNIPTTMNIKRQRQWEEVIRVIVRTLCESNDAVAREVGRVWEYAFDQVKGGEKPWIRMQESATQNKLLREFLLNGDSSADTALNASFNLDGLPRARMPSAEVAAALAAFGMFLGHKKQCAIDSLGRLPYTCALFDVPPKVFGDILETKKLSDVEREIIRRVAKLFPADPERRNYFRNAEAAAYIQQQFRFTHQLLTSTDVYQRGLEFYQQASKHDGPANTVTISNTSGLWNPHERLGTGDFVRRYQMKYPNELSFKDGFRATNFVDGILCPAHACRRIYLFNREGTWDAFRKAREAAKNMKAFDKDATRFLEEVCARMLSPVGPLHLVAVNNFAECGALPLATRISHGVLMFSNRHPNSNLPITHAFWCILESDSKVDPLAKVLQIVTDLAFSGVGSGLQALLPFLESLYGDAKTVKTIKEGLCAELVRRGLDSEPNVLLRLLRTRFKLDLEYLTPEMLRAEFKRNLS